MKKYNSVDFTHYINGQQHYVHNNEIPDHQRDEKLSLHTEITVVEEGEEDIKFVCTLSKDSGLVMIADVKEDIVMYMPEETIGFFLRFFSKSIKIKNEENGGLVNG